MLPLFRCKIWQKSLENKQKKKKKNDIRQEEMYLHVASSSNYFKIISTTVAIF